MKRKIYIIGSTTLIIIMSLILILGFTLVNKPTKVNAADNKYTITVTKVTTVSIYVTGENVELKSENISNSVYEVTGNSEFVLTCVNESRLFKNWVIQDDDGNNVEIANSNQSRIVLTTDKNLRVSTVRTDPTAKDLGKYIDSPFVLSSEANLLLLDNIFDYELNSASINDYQLLTAYNHFFKNDPEYKATIIDAGIGDAPDIPIEQKIAYINNNGYFERIQKGYFRVEESFTVLNETFAGIGSTTYPFQGVICGLNNANSSNAQIFLSINLAEKNEDLYCGLFEAIDENAVVRNLIIKNSIGISKSAASTKYNIYAGGVAGELTNSLLINLKISSTINIDATNKNIYAGGIAGKMTGGIDDISNLDLDYSNNTWSLTATENTATYGGLIAGYAEDTYIYRANINVSGYSINTKNVTSYNYSSGTNVYLGNLFGYYKNTITRTLKNIKLYGKSNEYIHSIVSSGNSYVGGLIGYIETNANLLLGETKFEIESNKTKIISESLDGESRTNLYSAGLVAYVKGNTFAAADDFKEGIRKIDVDGKLVDDYQYIFNASMEITAKQEGIQSNDLTYGNTIAAGIVAEGFFDINGTNDDERTNLLITSGEYSLTVSAIQTSMSSYSVPSDMNSESGYLTGKNFKNNVKHCLSSLTFGYLDAGSDTTGYTYKNINIYANNTNIEAYRSVGSTSLGDVNASGFLGYAKGRNIQNVTMYLGEGTSIKANSLSYEAGYAGSGAVSDSNNNVYVSAFVSHVIGVSASTTTNKNIDNIKISGYNFIDNREVGTSVEILGIQNSKAINSSGTGCGDYTNENYVGGVFGCIRGYFNISNIYYDGSPDVQSQIVMQGHRDPNTAFVGGIVGFAKLIRDNTSNLGNQTVTNCTIKNAKVYGSATISNDATYGNPDIYAGGIVGASFADSLSGTLTIDSAKVIDTEIICIGNERIEVYAGGIVGTQTWSGSLSVTDAYVYNSKVNAILESVSSVNYNRIGARASGIVPMFNSSTVSIRYSAIIDSEIIAKCSDMIESGKSNTGATILYVDGTQSQISATNCYTNSVVSATYGSTTKTDATQQIYGNLSSSNLDNCYYVKDKNPSITSIGIAIELDNQEFTESEQRSILSFASSYNADKSIKLFYKIFAENNFESTWQPGDSSNTIEIEAKAADATSEAEIWINAKASGDNLSPYDYRTEEERINAGWFNIGNIYLISGKKISDPSELVFEEDLFSRTYIIDGIEYKFNGVVDGKKEFITTKEPYKYLYDIGYEEQEKTQINYTSGTEELIIDCYTTDIYLKSTLSSVKLNFTIKLKNPESNVMPASYYDSWLKLIGTDLSSASVEKITMSDSPLIGYGGYSYSYEVVEYDTVNHYLMINYELIYTPNKELTEDVSLYVAFYVGSTVNSTDRIFANQCFRFNLYANKLILAGATLAEYTQPMNSVVDENLGTTIDNPYHFQVGSSYRIVPILKRKNEQENLIISELHIRDVIYNLTSLNDGNVNNKAGILRSNGELITGDTESSTTPYSITVTLKDDSSQQTTIYFVIVTKYNLSYTAVGANIDGLPFCTDASDYYLDINVLAHCGGLPESFVVKIGNTTYNLLDDQDDDLNYRKISNYKWIYDKNGNQLDYWDNNELNYQLRIPKEAINGDVSINMTFVVNFTIEFHIQTDTFNPDFGLTRDLVLSVKVKNGTKFNDLFARKILISNRDSHIGKTYKEVLDEWVNAANESSFGYLFTGFYLIDDSSSVSSYGQSFDKILEQNLTINTSYVFYARWSFLIELIEAPGTHIVTSFNQDFLYEVKQTDHEGLLNKNVIIPINNNRGYVFTIVKDDNFIGEADVEAYVISGSKNNQIINQIVVEKYHEDMYLYYIAPEDITGYLVISTKVSNSEIIVGENTASVNKEIIPEDGIYTFKYIVNHKKNESYIYNGKDGKNNLALNRELLLQFFEEAYDTNLGKTYLKPRNLVKNTIIEVYYNKYLNSSDKSSQTILGKYVVKDEMISKVKLTDFTNFNGMGSAFEQLTFSQLLGDYDSVSEVYYFVIIPPNGENNGYEYDDTKGMYGEYINNYLYLGYYDENSNEYINGLRSKNGFTNIPIEDLLKDQLQYESSCQIRGYTTTPSRVTKLEKDDTDSSLFHFTDDKKFNVFDVLVENGELTSNNRIRFFDSSLGKETIIRSNIITQGIYQLRLNFGFNKGTIKVSGSVDGENWDQIEIFDVERELYKDYIVNFDPSKDYKYFKIEKLSDAELRLSKIGLVVISNGMLYELEFVDSEFDDIYIPNYTIKNIPLPTMQGLTWTVSDSAAATISNDVLIVKRQATEQTITLKARYELEDQVKIKTFEIVIPSNNGSISIDEIIVPSHYYSTSTNSTFILPDVEGVTYEYTNTNGGNYYSKITKINGNVVTVSRNYYSNEVTIIARDVAGNVANKTITLLGTQNRNSSLNNTDIIIPEIVKTSFTLPSLYSSITYKLKEDNKNFVISGNYVTVTRQNTEQKVTLVATSGTTTKEYSITIPAIDFFEVELLELPSKCSSSLILPNVDGLVWEVVDGNASISDDTVSLIGESDMIKLKATYNGLSKEFDVYMQKNSSVYTLKQNIIGDLRHDNKRFVMAIQFKDETGNIVENVTNVSLLVNGISYRPIIDSGTNLNVLYFDLTDILETLNLSAIDIKVNKPDGYNVYVVQLLECSLHLKPAMGEVRASYVY